MKREYIFHVLLTCKITLALCANDISQTQFCLWESKATSTVTASNKNTENILNSKA